MRHRLPWCGRWNGMKGGGRKHGMEGNGENVGRKVVDGDMGRKGRWNERGIGIEWRMG